MRRDEIELSMPILTKVGEVFHLPESYGKDMVGKVVAVVDQTKGQTRVKLRVLSKALYEQEIVTPAVPAQQPLVSTEALQPRSHRYPRRGPAPILNQPHPPAATVAIDPAITADYVKKSQNLQYDPGAFTTPAQRFQAGVEKIVQPGGEYAPSQSGMMPHRPDAWTLSPREIASLLPAAQKAFAGSSYGSDPSGSYGPKQNISPAIRVNPNLPTHSHQDAPTGGFRRSSYQGRYTK